MAVYEPSGRLEIHPSPVEAEKILADAADRSMPALRRMLPALTACREWMYVEYRAGQHITPHIDGLALHPADYPRQIAGISVILEHATAGGEFYVETTSHPDIWNTDQPPVEGYHPHMTFTRDGADHSADWFRTMPRTRWSVTPQPGTALLYGSQLTHGTQPVADGRERKFISWLISDR